MNVITLFFLIIATAATSFAGNSTLPIINGQRIDDLRSSYATLAVRYEGVLSNIGQLTGRFDEFKYNADKLDQNVNKNRLKIDNLSKKVSSIGNKLNKLENKINLLSKGIDKLQIMLKTSASNSGALKKPPTGSHAPPVVAGLSKIPKTKTKPLTVSDDYDKAMNSLKQKNYKESLKLFSKFIKDNPEDKRIASAYFQKGEIYFALKQYDSAIIDYDQIVTRFPRSENIASAMLKEGICFLKLGDSIDARYLLKKVIQGFPGSNQSKRALSYLQKIK